MLSSFVSSRVHIYALSFLLGAVTLDLVFDGPVLLGVASDKDYEMIHTYYTHTMPHILATAILPALVVIGCVGIFVQVYLDRSIVSCVCLLMALVGGGGYGQILSAESELQGLSLNSGNIEEDVQSFNRLKEVGGTIAKSHVGLWEILFLGIIMQHIIVNRHPHHRQEPSSLHRYVHSRTHIYALCFLLGTMSIDFIFDLPIVFGESFASSLSGVSSSNNGLSFENESFRVLHAYYQRTMPSFMGTIIMPLVVVFAFAGIIIQGMMIDGEDSLMSRLCLIMMMVGGYWFRTVEMPLEKEFPYIDLNSGSELDQTQAFNRVKEIGTTISSGHVGLWSMILIGAVMQHLVNTSSRETKVKSN